MKERPAMNRIENQRLRPIEPNVLYPLKLFQQYAGIANHGLRTARRNGMRVLRVSNRAYVLGSDFIEYVIRVQADPMESQNTRS